MKTFFVGFKYDYGLKSRGESLEARAFYPAIVNYSSQCYSLWLEEFGYPNDIIGLQEKIIEYADKIEPDLIFFVLMKNEIKNETISYLTSKYKTLNWFCDDQWRYDSFTKKIAPLFTYSVTVDKYRVPEYLKNGIVPIQSQWASFEYASNLNFETIEYLNDVTFVGSKNLTREWIVNELEKKGIHVKCYGSGWASGKITYDEMKLFFLNSKINLNLSNSVPKDTKFILFILKKFLFQFINPFEPFSEKIDFLKQIKSLLFSRKKIEQIKARNFEIPGFGGFQISKFALQLEDYYEIGKEIILFSDIDELAHLINYYLINQKQREYIRTCGYIRAAEHNYFDRISKVFNQILSR